MYCENCGRKSNPGEKFCADCGTPLRNNVSVDSKAFSKPKEKKKISKGLIIGIVLGVFAIFISIIIGIIALAFSFVNKYETKEYITLGSDKIPSVYSSLGKKNIVSVNAKYNSSGQTLELSYSDSNFTDDELTTYLTSLTQDGFYLIDDSKYIFMYLKESNDSGKLIFVYGSRDYNAGTITIDYVKEKGNIDDYSLKSQDGNGIRVGKKIFGYIDMPSTAQVYTSANSTSDVIQYSDTNRSFLLSLSYVEKPDYTVSDYVAYEKDMYEKDDATVKIDSETVDGYTASTILAASSDGWISKEWLLLDKNNVLHYIYMGTYNDTSIFDYIKTYKINS